MLQLRPLKELWRSGPGQSAFEGRVTHIRSQPVSSTRTGTGLWLLLPALQLCERPDKSQDVTHHNPFDSPVRLVESSPTTQSENLQSFGRDMTSPRGRRLGTTIPHLLRTQEKVASVRKSSRKVRGQPLVWCSSIHTENIVVEFERPRGNQSHQFRIGWLPRCGGCAAPGS